MSVNQVVSTRSFAPTFNAQEESSSLQAMVLSVLFNDGNEQTTKSQIEDRIVVQIKSVGLRPSESLIENVRQFLDDLDTEKLYAKVKNLCSTLEFEQVCSEISRCFPKISPDNLNPIIERLYFKTLIEKIRKEHFPFISCIGCEMILRKMDITPSNTTRRNLEENLVHLFDEQMALLEIYLKFEVTQTKPHDSSIANLFSYYKRSQASTLRVRLHGEYKSFFQWVVNNSTKPLEELCNQNDYPHSSFTSLFLSNLSEIYDNALIYRICKKKYPNFMEHGSFPLMVQDWRDSGLQQKSSIETFYSKPPVNSRFFVYAMCIKIFGENFNKRLFSFLYEKARKQHLSTKKDVINFLNGEKTTERNYFLNFFWNLRKSDKKLIPSGIFHSSKSITQIRVQLYQEYKKAKDFLETVPHLTLQGAWEALTPPLELISYDRFKDVFLDISDCKDLISKHLTYESSTYSETVAHQEVQKFKATLDMAPNLENALSLFLEDLNKRWHLSSQIQNRTILFTLQAANRYLPKQPTLDLAKRQDDVVRILDLAKELAKTPSKSYSMDNLKTLSEKEFHHLLYLSFVTIITKKQIMKNGKRLQANFEREEEALPISELLGKDHIPILRKWIQDLLSKVFPGKPYDDLSIERDVRLFFNFLRRTFDAPLKK